MLSKTRSFAQRRRRTALVSQRSPRAMNVKRCYAANVRDSPKQAKKDVGMKRIDTEELPTFVLKDLLYHIWGADRKTRKSDFNRNVDMSPGKNELDRDKIFGDKIKPKIIDVDWADHIKEVQIEAGVGEVIRQAKEQAEVKRIKLEEQRRKEKEQIVPELAELKIYEMQQEKKPEMISEIPSEIPFDMTREMPVEMTREIPFDMTREMPIEMKPEMTTEIPREIPSETPFEMTREMPVEMTREITIEMTREIPFDVTKEMPIEMPREIPIDMTRELLREMTREIPVEIPREMPIEMTREMPRDIFVEMPVEMTREEMAKEEEPMKKLPKMGVSSEDVDWADNLTEVQIAAGVGELIREAKLQAEETRIRLEEKRLTGMSEEEFLPEVEFEQTIETTEMAGGEVENNMEMNKREDLQWVDHLADVQIEMGVGELIREAKEQAEVNRIKLEEKGKYKVEKRTEM